MLATAVDMFYQIKAMISRILTVLLLLLSIQEIQCMNRILSKISEQILDTDITHQILVNRASLALKSTYLSNFQGQIATQYSGIIFGLGKRALISLPVRHSHASCPIQINVIFKVDTGAPTSSLTTQALNKLYKNCPRIEQTFNDDYPVIITGHNIRVQESQAHFQTVSILGADFLEEKNCRLEFDYLKYGGGKFKLLLQASMLTKKNQSQEL